MRPVKRSAVIQKSVQKPAWNWKNMSRTEKKKFRTFMLLLGSKMQMTQFDISSTSGRILMKAITLMQRQASYVSVTPLQDPHSRVIYALRIACVDAADSSALAFQFERSFFTQIQPGWVLPYNASGCTYSAKLLTRCFRGVSPNKLSEIKLRLSGDFLEFHFMWKTGMVSIRQILCAVPPENLPLVPMDLPSTVQPVEKVALSMSPQYLSGLLAHIPDSETLWAITLSHRKDENVSTGSIVYVTNAIPGIQDASSVVGLTISQAELSRNGSHIHDSCFPLDFSLKIPLTELRGVASLISDDVFKEDFSLGIGFSKYANNRDVLTVHAVARSLASHSAFTVKLWFKGSPVPEFPEYFDDVKLEDLDLDEIDPSRSVHSPTASTPFIQHSAAGTVVQTASQPFIS
jgi:hypothetical protein